MTTHLMFAVARSLALLFLMLATAAAAPFPLAKEGKAQAVIVLGNQAGDLTRLAASELQNYVSQLGGVRLPQVAEGALPPTSQQQTILLLGAPGQNRLLDELVQSNALNTTSLKPEGFILKSLNWKERPTLIIAGADEAGVLYGAYELLERLGVTFRLTGDLVPPRQSALSLPSLDLRLEPAFHRRGFLHPVNFDNASMFSRADYERLLDQMARMKCNYLQFWWFAYGPWIKFSYRGEAAWMGDVSAKESGYHSWRYGGFGSRTTNDISIGLDHFRDRPRMAPPEMQQVETPEQAYEIAQNMLHGILDHAVRRNIKVWLVVEMASLPPNLARHGEIVGDAPFNYVFGTFLHPLDPVNREIQVNRLKALAATYPEAEGIYLNFAELYPKLVNEKHRDFFERERPRFQPLRSLSAPWIAALASIYDVNVDEVVDSNIGYFDLFSYLLKARDTVAPGTRLGLMTTGRGYALPFFHQLVPTNVPFASLESSGVWTMTGVPMDYFGGMGARERIIQPRVDDDFDMLGPQFSVRQCAQKDRIFVDGVRVGLSGFAGQVERARGTEFNSSFLAQAAWQPDLTPEQFYRAAVERMFGPAAAPEMYEALMKLEENQAWLGYYEYNGGYGVLLCCSGIREVNAASEYARQKNPFAGPTMRSWKRLIADSADAIARREGSIGLLNQALAHMRAAATNVAPQGKNELHYLLNRVEAYRDFLAALNDFRRGMIRFDEAFRHRTDSTEGDFVRQLESSLSTVQEAQGKLAQATLDYSRIIDHVSDLAVLYHLNARVVLGTDLAVRFLENVVNYHRGKPYLEKVPFDRLFPPRPDKGAEE